MKLPDGTVVAYLDADFRPVPQVEARLAKVLYPDGRVVFAIPTELAPVRP